MIPYITYRELNNGELLYFILQKEYPHYIGFVSEEPINKISIAAVPISTYNLWVCFAYTLRGSFIPSYKNVLEEIQAVMVSMSIWFLENRILQNEKKYKKWKINDSGSN